jgi:hypothetical protein
MPVSLDDAWHVSCSGWDIMMTHRYWLVLLIASCRTPGTMPHEMSAEQHEAAAQKHEQQAQCMTTPIPPGSPCWTSVNNPAEADERAVARHKRIAAEHRAASQALRDAEASACAGIDEYNREVSPLSHREDIVGVQTVYGRSAKGALFREGVAVSFRPIPGLTAEWLQRQVDCHIAHAAVLGHDISEMTDCPLVLRGVRATVSSTGNGFIVQIRSDDFGTAREIEARARKLAQAR